MAWDPYKKKFKSRKYRLAPEDNFKLDKIRGLDDRDGKEEKQRQMLNVWTVMIVSVALLVVALIIPKIAETVIVRRHTDALVDLHNARMTMTKNSMETGIADNTIFVIERGGRYYMFWYKQGAAILGKKGEGYSAKYADLVEISDPGQYILPVNVAEGKSLEYPFLEEPIQDKDGKIKLLDGLEVLSGMELAVYAADEDTGNEIASNVKLYSLKKAQ